MALPEIPIYINDPNEISVYLDTNVEVRINLFTSASVSSATGLILSEGGEELWQIIARDGKRIWQKKVDGAWVDYDEWD